MFVGVFECAGDGGGDLEGLAFGEFALALEDLAKALALDILHGEVVVAVGLPRINAQDDIGVVEFPGGLCLADEAFDEIGLAGQARGKDLQGHYLVEALHPGLVDGSHSALPDPGEELESADTPQPRLSQCAVDGLELRAGQVAFLEEDLREGFAEAHLLGLGQEGERLADLVLGDIVQGDGHSRELDVAFRHWRSP